jgi:hypothetical protein
MFKQIKKELEDINNYKEHINSVPHDSLNPQDNFDELVKLTTRTNARFKVNGDSKKFVIQAQSDNIVIGICLITILFFPTLGLYKNLTNPIYWLVEFGILVVFFLFFRYYPSTNNIEVNSYEKTIIISSNNLIGKFIIPTIDISFKDFTKFTFKETSISGKGMTSNFNRIYICYNGQTRPIIDLSNGPLYFINHRIFMICLTRIIKNGA